MIKIEKKPNLLTMIFKDMLRIVEGKKVCTLLYGMLLNLIFIELQVDISCDLHIMHQTTIVINKRSMHSFGYR
ncbi:hypothetical protein PTKIN_Ptkin05aG0140700 [Pterospermum kingtungense]